MLEGGLWTLGDGASATNVVGSLGECLQPVSLLNEGDELLCALVLCTATYLCFFSGDHSVSLSSSLAGFTGIFN